MHLRQSLARYFRNENIAEGSQIAKSGDVSILQGTQHFVVSEVHDELKDAFEPWEVSLRRQGAVVTCECDCGEHNCAHGWATIITADERGLLTGSGGSGAPYMMQTGRLSSAVPVDGHWREVLAKAARPGPVDVVPAPVPGRKLELEIFYEINPGTISWRPGLGVSIRCREKRSSGQWGVIKALQIKRSEVALLSETDRVIVERLAGSRKAYDYDQDNMPADFLISGPHVAETLATLCETRRTFLPGPQMASPVNLNWDSGPPWTFDLVIKRDSKGWQLTGRLKRGDDAMSLLEPRFITDSGVLCVRDVLARFETGNSYSWIETLRKEGNIRVPYQRGEDLVKELMSIRNCPPVEWPDELKFEEIRMAPRPQVTFMESRIGWNPLTAPVRLELAFGYGDEVVPDTDPRKGFYLENPRRLITRDFDAELQAMATLDGTGAKISKYNEQPRWEIPRKRVPPAVRDLVRAGWQVKLDGKTFRSSTSVNAEIKSGIDWFEVHGSVVYGDSEIPFPRLLAALERGEQHVQLSDGTLGVLPDDFLTQYGALLRLGKKDGDHIRFTRAQTSLLDALLFERGEVSADEAFMRARSGLRNFEGLHPATQPRDFRGELRHYQLEGLGWMEFLRSLGLGGCLADDMGVGKTPQVLALLENRRTLRASLPAESPDRPGTSIVVVPRSLIYNWKQEAARFTPYLRVLDHSLPHRTNDTAEFGEFDLILTTYGLLRRDVVDFRDYEFDYAILDEAQAIKNSGSASAKAARLIKAKHRLVMSGTPIENHLGELWSLFEFLNPGILGTASVFQKARRH